MHKQQRHIWRRRWRFWDTLVRAARWRRRGCATTGVNGNLLRRWRRRSQLPAQLRPAAQAAVRSSSGRSTLHSSQGFASIGNTATGSYTSGGATYSYYQFTASSTLTVNVAGFADVLVVGAGGSGGHNTPGGGGGGGAGGVLVATNFHFAAGSHDVVIGAGGASQALTTVPVSQGQLRVGSAGAPGGGGGGGRPDSSGLARVITVALVVAAVLRLPVRTVLAVQVGRRGRRR